MQWEWRSKTKSYRTIRAVDTATHPAHQGKGIFKKLTLEQLERCKQEGISFVFNTPNSQSMPGYLKMGWQVQGKMPLKIQAISPLSTALRIALKKKPLSVPANSASSWDSVLSAFKDRLPFAPDTLHTPYSEAYVRWRYAGNPLFPYSFITDNKNYLLIYRIKEHNRFSEFRITDIYIFNGAVNIKREISKQIKL
jgi:hypothetical protein